MSSLGLPCYREIQSNPWWQTSAPNYSNYTLSVILSSGSVRGKEQGTQIILSKLYLFKEERQKFGRRECLESNRTIQYIRFLLGKDLDD